MKTVEKNEHFGRGSCPRKPSRYGFFRQSGQALIEFGFILFMMTLLVFGAVDLGTHISFSSNLVGAARAGALVLTPSNIVGTIDDVPTSAYRDILYAISNQTNVDQTQFAQQGQIIVSFLIRNPDASTSPGSSTDRLRIERQYIRPPGGSGTAPWASKFGTGPSSDPGEGYNYTMIPLSKLDPSVVGFNRADWIVVVELFHPPVMITPLKRLLGVTQSQPDALYEYTIY